MERHLFCVWRLGNIGAERMCWQASGTSSSSRTNHTCGRSRTSSTMHSNGAQMCPVLVTALSSQQTHSRYAFQSQRLPLFTPFTFLKRVSFSHGSLRTITSGRHTRKSTSGEGILGVPCASCTSTGSSVVESCRRLGRGVRTGRVRFSYYIAYDRALLKLIYLCRVAGY